MTATAIVTGGSAGIGLAIANRLGRDGHRVIIVGRDRDRLDDAAEQLTADGLDVATYALDVRDHKAVEQLFDTHPAALLVNNAAGNFACPALDMSPNGFRAVVEISLYGSFYCSTAMARRLIKRGSSGAIVNIIATYAWTGAPLVAHSAAGKAGMLAFTKSVAREWGEHGIRVNAVAPGFVPTDAARKHILPTEEAENNMLAQIPLGRFGRANEVADAAAYLLSDAAAYITGTVLTVDGGRSLGGAMHASQKPDGPDVAQSAGAPT